MTMRLEDLCAKLRSTKIGTVLRETPSKNDFNNATITFWDDDPENAAFLYAPEFVEALRIHQGVIGQMIKWSDVRVCMRPDGHRSSYRYITDWPHPPGFCCDMCAKIRLEKLATLPTEGITLADFRDPDH